MLPDPRLNGYVIYFDSQKQTKLREAMIIKTSTKQKKSRSAKDSYASAQILKLMTSCKLPFFIWKEDHEQMQTTDRGEHSREDDNS